ncbi:MAG: hypothetical protein ACOYJJ_01390 [Anaerovoracaceae bacterium]|jgi:hypothetical protein
MEGLTVGILLKDAVYAEALARGIAEQGRRFRILVLDFRCPETDRQMLGSLRSCRYLLTDFECLSDRPLGTDASVIRLCERDDGAVAEDRIYRYERADRIAGRIAARYGEETGIDVLRREEKRIRKIAFFGLYGGCGCTAAATAAARIFERSFGMRVLLLNLGHLDGSYRYQAGTSSEDKTYPLMFYLTKGGSFPLSEFLQSGSFPDRLSCMTAPFRKEELSPQMLSELIEKIESTSGYDYVFLDVGTRLDGRNREVLEDAEQIVLVDRLGRVAEEAALREDFFRTERMLTGRQRILFSGGGSDPSDRERIMEGGTFSVVPMAQENGAFHLEEEQIRIDLSGVYGRSIYQLAEALLIPQEASGGPGQGWYGGLDQE